MGKDREIACKFYIAERLCSKEREGTFYNYCQKCNLYSPIKGGRPARQDLRQKKKEKLLYDIRNWN